MIAASDITAERGARKFENVLQSLLFPKLVVHRHRSPSVLPSHAQNLQVGGHPDKNTVYPITINLIRPDVLVVPS
jgi:hypothetical protein